MAPRTPSGSPRPCGTGGSDSRGQGSRQGRPSGSSQSGAHRASGGAGQGGRDGRGSQRGSTDRSTGQGRPTGQRGQSGARRSDASERPGRPPSGSGRPLSGSGRPAARTQRGGSSGSSRPAAGTQRSGSSGSSRPGTRSQRSDGTASARPTGRSARPAVRPLRSDSSESSRPAAPQGSGGTASARPAARSQRQEPTASGRPAGGPRRSARPDGDQARANRPGAGSRRGSGSQGRPSGQSSGGPSSRSAERRPGGPRRGGTNSGGASSRGPERRPYEDRSSVVRKGWGSVARRGASTVRDGTDGHGAGTDEDTPEGRRQRRTRTDAFEPERWVEADRRPARRTGEPRSPSHRPVPAAGPAELPADIANELASAAGPDWSTLRTRVSERMAAGIGAYERERYRDASRILKTVVDAVPNAPSVRELAGTQPVPAGLLEGRPSQPGGIRRPDRLGRHAPGADGLPPGPRPAQEGRGALGRATARVARPRGTDRGSAGPSRHPGGQRGPERGHRPPARSRRWPSGPEPGRTPPPAVVRTGRSDRALGRATPSPRTLHAHRRRRSRCLRRRRPARVPGSADSVPSQAEWAASRPLGSALMDLEKLLGDEADSLLNHKATAFPAENLIHPGPDHLDLRSANRIARPPSSATWPLCTAPGAWPAPATFRSSRSTKASSTRPRPASPRTRRTSTRPGWVDLAIAADCSAIATTLGGFGHVSRRYAERMPFIVKLNHNDFLNYPNTYDQTMFGSAQTGRRPRGRRGGCDHLLRVRTRRPADR